MVRVRPFDVLWIATGLLAGAALALMPADGTLATAGQSLFHWAVEPFTRLLYAGFTCI